MDLALVCHCRRILSHKDNHLTQADDSLAIDALDSFIEANRSLNVYTHASATRIAILGIFCLYLVLMVFFIDFLRDKVQSLEQIPEAFAALSDPVLTQVVFYLITGIGLILALAILLYFLWSVVDIWGLQVIVREEDLIIQNTIVGSFLGKWTGVGSILLDNITELRGSKSATHVVGGDIELHFSPVDQVDRLIDEILAKAKNARIK